VSFSVLFKLKLLLETTERNLIIYEKIEILTILSLQQPGIFGKSGFTWLMFPVSYNKCFC
jgi:hypothetical protein